MSGRFVKAAYLLLAASAALSAQDGTRPVAQTARPSAGANSVSNEVTLQVIVVRSSEEAEQVLQRLNKSEDFAALAREKSIDPTASAGGYMGKFATADLRTELREALQGVAPGELSKVFST